MSLASPSPSNLPRLAAISHVRSLGTAWRWHAGWIPALVLALASLAKWASADTAWSYAVVIGQLVTAMVLVWRPAQWWWLGAGLFSAFLVVQFVARLPGWPGGCGCFGAWTPPWAVVVALDAVCAWLCWRLRRPGRFVSPSSPVVCGAAVMAGLLVALTMRTAGHATVPVIDDFLAQHQLALRGLQADVLIVRGDCERCTLLSGPLYLLHRSGERKVVVDVAHGQVTGVPEAERAPWLALAASMAKVPVPQLVQVAYGRRTGLIDWSSKNVARSASRVPLTTTFMP